MRAMVATEFGTPDVLRMQDIPEPTPGEHDLLVEVHASALNPVDTKIRRGSFRLPRQFPFPLGFDVSGVVLAMGPAATGFEIGDEVYASPSLIRAGSNADLVCVDARTASAKPLTLDHVHAAAMPLVTLTAWESLYERANLRAGETVLIQAGGGGVGHIAIQLAKLRGCRVITTASRDESVALCKAMGADHVIDYKRDDVTAHVHALTEGKGVPVVFECVGGATFEQSVAALALNGRMVTIVGAGPEKTMGDLYAKNATLHFELMAIPTMHNLHPERQGEILAAAAALVDAGKLRVHVSRTIELGDVPAAHRSIEAGHTTGKIAVRMR